MDDEVRKYAKADAFGKDAMAAVTLTERLVWCKVTWTRHGRS